MIQRFEFTIEYTRKTLKKILSYKGEDDNLFPKDIFRVFQKLGLIDNLDVWFMFLNERNRLSHMYGEEIAQQSHTMIRAYISEFRDFYDRICTYLHRQDA